MENFGKPVPPAPSPENYQLKWHKFLIYFALWAGAVLNLSNAVACLNGTQYGNQAAQVYTVYSGMKTVDVIYGIALLALTAYMIYVRFELARFKIGAPSKLYVLYIINVVLGVLYTIVVSSVTRLPFSSLLSDSVGPIIGAVIMLFINQNYYNKRLELFIN